MKSKVVIASTRTSSACEAVRRVFEELEWHRYVPHGARVVIKPNLSWPGRDKATQANTSREVLDAVIRIVRERTHAIVVGESDGTRFSVDDCFEASGYGEVISGTGVRWVNFSKGPTEPVGIPLLEGFELPVELLRCDVLITLPKLKTHGLTYFTGALKNQWGCIPRHDRILLHRYLNELIVEINRLLKPGICIMDGILAMEGRGPVNGRKVELGVVLGSRDPVALDASAMRLVSLDPGKATHVVLAAQSGLGAFARDDIELAGDVTQHFRIEPARSEWPVRFMDYLSRYHFFTHRILLNNTIFGVGKGAVSVLRRVGLS